MMTKLTVFSNPNFPLFLHPQPDHLRRRPSPSTPSFSVRFGSGLGFGIGRRRFLVGGAESVSLVGKCVEDNVDGSEVRGDAEEEDFDLPVDLCITRDLNPVVTLREGVERIKVAIAKLKAEPLCCKSGVIRFQVRIPPSASAEDWFYSQYNYVGVFPQFLFSLKNNKDAANMALLNGSVGVSGVGAAIYIQGSSYTPKENLTRYLSIDSPLIRAYGFIGNNYSKESSLAKNKDVPFYIFIPQIELDEFEGSSLLASTVIWDDHQHLTFQHAIKSVEFYLDKLIFHRLSVNSFLSDEKYIYGYGGLIDVKDTQMVWLNAENPCKQDIETNSFLLEQSQDCFQYYFRLSDVQAFGNIMVAYSCEINHSLNEFSNINAVWASLVVEECVRLGLTYFCVAPGSRSSPLAICAASHPQTTCISCFDERSLAFHAVGYAKGSTKPAVIITTSGTAVSNLLPAVVEASHYFVPLLLLTADRPSELQDTGANQTIYQVDHFGKFVRFFFNLPPPSDDILARMVLTTIDSAIYKATQSPCGPVHINFPFREPLDNSPSEWNSKCLQGLNKWMSDSKPFTTYFNVSNFSTIDEHTGQISEVVQIIQRAKQGLILLGTINNEDEIWAAFLLAKHLFWPVVSDILSGLRLRKLFASLPHIGNQFPFIDHLDHALLSELVTNWAKPDVVLQLGSRITSKRVAEFLECCQPSSYILVDKHPCRHDSSHLVSLRIQSTINVFSEALLKIQFSTKMTKWGSFWQAIDLMVSREISYQICLENSLTEPYVSHVISSCIQSDGALFVGNSMAIRDMDMYGKGCVESVPSLAELSQAFPYQGIQVAGNRGASGIDGLLSSAIGFAVGCNKRVLCMIGDVSFLHDTNGLAILNERMQRKPITILVINNHGGAIFSLLPIAERTHTDILEKYFYTSHDISISKLCAAHSINHQHVQTKMELQHALSRSQESNTDCVIEVESSVSDNSNFHSMVRRYACEVANQTMETLLSVSDDAQDCIFACKINKMEYSLYRIQLSSPPTSASMINDGHKLYKEGFVLTLTLVDGTRGYGEVAPIEIHKENMHDVEEQLRFLVHVIEGSEIKFLPLLCGSFTTWFWRALGIMPSSLFPSLRCGIEMALLHALANKQVSGDLFLRTAFQSTTMENGNTENSSHVAICALVDCNGNPGEVSHIVSHLVDEGFTTIKLKVARRANPNEDAAVINEIRNTVGYQINIRVDANRKWTYEEAFIFGSCVRNCRLQYIEEPVQYEDDIIKFCDTTSLPVALDETIDNLKGDVFIALKKFIHPGIAAIVIKPSVVGGFENALVIASWADKHEKMVIISSAFETSLSLSIYIQFALNLQRWKKTKTQGHDMGVVVAHGFGTYKWLKEDIAIEPLKMHVHSHGGTIGVSKKDSSIMVQNFEINDKVIQRSYEGEKLLPYSLEIVGENYDFSIRLLETQETIDESKVAVFLHGFLGTSEEWVPIMKAFSAKTRCISIDLPGHGQSHIQWKKENVSKKDHNISVELVGDLLHNLLCDITSRKVILVGYSLGARIALYMSLKYNHKIEGSVLISGSPGLKDESLRRIRIAQDDSKSQILSACGLSYFTEIWYQSKLWNSLRNHPHFEEIRRTRERHLNHHAVAKSLSDLSVGRQLPLWGDLKQCKVPLLVVVGQKDTKFNEIAHQMCDEINCSTDMNSNSSSENKLCTVIEVPGCGHAVHLENPLAVVHAIGKFLRDV